MHAHHLMRVDGIKGTAMKTSDKWAIPLDSLHHGELHDMGDEVAFFKKYGWEYSDVRKYAEDTWARFNR